MSLTARFAFNGGGTDIFNVSVLKSLRHYPRAQSQGHHTIDRPEEREAWKEAR